MEGKCGSNENHRHSPRDISHFPEHAQKYPSLAKYHLCDVKRSINYPKPPSMRNIDRDNFLHKLPDEHCRQTTFCEPRCFDTATENYEETKYAKRDFCIDKLLEKYSLDPRSLKNKPFEILNVCPSERRQFENMCDQHKGESYCIRYDPSLMRKKQEEISCMSCYLNAPWN